MDTQDTTAKAKGSPGLMYPWEKDPRKLDGVLLACAKHQGPEYERAATCLLGLDERTRLRLLQVVVDWESRSREPMRRAAQIPNDGSARHDVFRHICSDLKEALEERAPDVVREFGDVETGFKAVMVLKRAMSFLLVCGPSHAELERDPERISSSLPGHEGAKSRETSPRADRERAGRFLEVAAELDLAGQMAAPAIARLRRKDRQSRCDASNDVPTDVLSHAASALVRPVPHRAVLAMSCDAPSAPLTPAYVFRMHAPNVNKPHRWKYAERKRSCSDADEAHNAREALAAWKGARRVADARDEIDHVRALAHSLARSETRRGVRGWLQHLAEHGTKPSIEELIEATGLTEKGARKARTAARRALQEANSKEI